MILASHETEGPTDSLKFSLDQGACWHNIRLEEAIDIQNIRWTSHFICASVTHLSDRSPSPGILRPCVLFTVQSSLSTTWHGCRVEPKATSHVFVVHGQACLTTPAHPSCTHSKEGTKPVGKIYVVDLKPVLGSDWRV